MSAALAFQQVSRVQLAADPDVSALVPPANILDANGAPERFPCIRLGEDQELSADEVVGRYSDVFATMHVWTREPGLAGAKAIAGAMRRALRGQAWTLGNFQCLDTRFEGARFIRDPDGQTAHGIVTFKAVIEEL